MVDILALLVAEPHSVPLDRAIKLTPAQITLIYFRERTEDGVIKLPESEPVQTLNARELFERWGFYNKLPAWRIEKLWRRRGSVT